MTFACAMYWPSGEGFRPSRQTGFPALCTVLIAGSVLHHSALALCADDATPVRSQAVVNLSFDEASGDALDSATAGAARETGLLQNGAHRVKSPFWGQSGRQGLALDGASRQFVQVADSPDLDRPD